MLKLGWGYHQHLKEEMTFKSPQQALEPSHGNQIQSMNTMVRSRGDSRRLDKDKQQGRIRIFGMVSRGPGWSILPVSLQVAFWVL